MIIKSITLDNFRQYTGSQTITFSTDPIKKVTFVMAESGVGKTTILNAFQWVFYGRCKYTNILNENVKTSLMQGEGTWVSVSTVVNYNNIDYEILRKQRFYKSSVVVNSDSSVLQINYIDDEGINHQIKNQKEANDKIRDIMHEDLFPYFFLEGENLKRTGEQMAKGKNGKNSDFAKAVEGLLNLGYLYDSLKHLESVSKEYDEALKKTTSNHDLKNTIEEIDDYKKYIEKNYTRINNLQQEVQYYDEQRKKKSEELMKYGGIAEKQSRSKELGKELTVLNGTILQQRKDIMKKFSSESYVIVAGSMLNDVKDVLEDVDAMDKGIPGMNASSIQWLLDNHICICGEKLIEGSEHWNKLKDLMTYLPPNNIASELKVFCSDLEWIKKQQNSFENDFKEKRKKYATDTQEYYRKHDELSDINGQIAGVNTDIGLLKKQEQECINKIAEDNSDINLSKSRITEYEYKIKELESKRQLLEQNDSKTKRLQNLSQRSKTIWAYLNTYVKEEEQIKRKKLTEAINKIFSDFYKEKITFELDRDYDVQIKTESKDLHDDFTSGGQDVAVALAFIGGIIKLNSEQDAEDGTKKKETYPLVMDAPTSAFGMKQMDSFCEITPKITDQIIVFINDKDGPILKEKLNGQIGSEWELHKNDQDSYHTQIIKGGI